MPNMLNINLNCSVKQISNTISPSIRNIINALSSHGKSSVLNAAGQKFKQMTLSNFGGNGQYKESNWPPLSRVYAKKVGRSNATLEKTRALYESIKVSAPKGNTIQIYSKNPYASVHAFGSTKLNIPKRNYWPTRNYSNTLASMLNKSETEMINTISKQFNILSSGQLPIITNINTKTNIIYGNVFASGG